VFLFYVLKFSAIMVNPFLKWPGGKRWATSSIVPILAQSLTGTYFEPFLGGGAVFFRLRPRKAVLSDINQDLINVYLAVQQNPHDLLTRLKRMPVSYDHYYHVRSSSPRLAVARATRFLYLNRTAFGGIYRLNRQGSFNVPYGGGRRTPAPLWEGHLLLEASRALAGTTIRQSDFEPILDQARMGDAVYCDPTYTVTHDTNGFVRYNETNFAWADQERLAAAAARAARRGALVLVSNAHHPAILNLYPSREARVLQRTSCVSRDPCKRTSVLEYLFVLRP
jgi:DNA adenine methylase